MATPKGLRAVPNYKYYSTRATRGSEGYRTQPQKRFQLAVKARISDGNRLTAGERIGNGMQGYIGPVIGDKLPYISTTSRADFMSAFNKRVNFRTTERVHGSIRASAIQLIRELVPAKLEEIVWDNELFYEWNEQFDSEKRARMLKAYNEMGLERLQDYTTKEIFTKIEALVKDHDTVAPRVIFKGTDYYNMMSGPMFKVLMERFKSCEKNAKKFDFKLCYRQHTPEIVEFMESKPCKSYMQADFTSNDKTQVRDVIELECKFMRRLGCPKWFIRLHRASNKFSVYNSKFGVSADVENALPTGATDTTFRNSWWNLTIFNSWAHKYRVDGAVVAVLGDDLLAGLDRRVRRCAYHYEQVARLAKMIARVTTSPLLQRMSLLSKHFVPVTRGEQSHVMLPLIGKVLAKFNVRPNSNESVTDDEYMAGKSLSHCYEFRYCHVLRDLFVERANYHLQRSGGKYSIEGITYHVRVFSVHKGLIDKMLAGATEWPDLVTTEDLTMFWITLGDLAFSDVYPLIKSVVLTHGFRILDNFALSSLGDY